MFAFISPARLDRQEPGLTIRTRSGGFLLRPQLLFGDQTLHEVGTLPCLEASTRHISGVLRNAPWHGLAAERPEGLRSD